MKNDEKNQFPISKVLVAVLVYGVLSTLLLVLFNWVLSILISKEVLYEGFVSFSSAISVFLASLISGLFSSKAMGKALIVSVFQGLINFLLYYIMGMLIFMRIIPQDSDVYHFIACMVGAMTGGILSAALSPRRRKIKK